MVASVREGFHLFRKIAENSHLLKWKRKKKKKHAHCKMPYYVSMDVIPVSYTESKFTYVKRGLHLTLCVKYTNSERGNRWKLMASLNTSMVGKIKAISINY